MGDTAPGGIVGKSRGSPLRGGAEQGAGGRSGRAHPHPGRCSRPVSTALVAQLLPCRLARVGRVARAAAVFPGKLVGWVAALESLRQQGQRAGT